MTGILAGFVLFAVLIIVHEMGHLLAAKWVGARAPIFSIGFGPKLYSFVYGGTEYRLAAVPFGGYVLMEQVSESGTISPLKRMFVFAAGPLANFAFAAVLFYGIGQPQMFWQSFNALTEVLIGLFSGHTPGSDLVGPIGIVNVAGQFANLGIIKFLAFLAFMSLNLAVMNLLPLPVLDGGQIVIAAIEGLIRRPLGQNFRLALALSAWVMLLSLFAVVTVMDIRRLIGA